MYKVTFVLKGYVLVQWYKSFDEVCKKFSGLNAKKILEVKYCDESLKDKYVNFAYDSEVI
ncbi:hypothetical protein UFOVP1666_132 [uncultured Caudovirales phage]|uniref:Uncharacterized protein n=1 Tax=uncultured Caudovirales phage TaxID=2100421 RepID=A0A6J5Q431_9CAUD|nr:hypothetical protein UFOVP867_87 [uncultured Caudovirales phage]CAB4170793.1 hypothetical protein UFOVP913_111 [uncultured Caudovirales phage]CAB4177086.1 hypothetical protein UFOVP993_164 [uncultured Caudovirales phage]CAB4223103.1 hypothetical protein UFOVP1666_132 [uncultured Caudovirales phage]